MNKVQKKKPIGIFDSGIGGLTVARAVAELLPHEDIIYFGDTAHLPYGDKSANAIKSYCGNITDFLKTFDCKMIVIACNTASASGFKTVVKAAGKNIPVMNVVDPVVEHLVQIKEIKSIGVIGTKRTIESGIYAKKISQSCHKKVKSLATPLLAPMIEEGFFNNKISQTIINSYLEKKALSDIDALILACTHYPLIKKEIETYYKKEVMVLDSAKIVALKIEQTLSKLKLLSTTKTKGSYRFYVSDYTESFEKTSKLFFGSHIRLKEASQVHPSL
ncbi:MAG: glutamate racemase [Bacteriovoracaceae bacterium]